VSIASLYFSSQTNIIIGRCCARSAPPPCGHSSIYVGQTDARSSCGINREMGAVYLRGPAAKCVLCWISDRLWRQPFLLRSAGIQFQTPWRVVDNRQRAAALKIRTAIKGTGSPIRLRHSGILGAADGADHHHVTAQRSIHTIHAQNVKLLPDSRELYLLGFPC
jgi:hypothetical protein